MDKHEVWKALREPVEKSCQNCKFQRPIDHVSDRFSCRITVHKDECKIGTTSTPVAINEKARYLWAWDEKTK